MWQRFKNAVDDRIQEEQARQKAPGSAAPRPSTSTARPRSDSRDLTPNGRRRRREDVAASVAVSMPVGKEPDPETFEPEFVIGEEGDESVNASRVGTPAPVVKVTSTDSETKDVEGGDKTEKRDESTAERAKAADDALAPSQISLEVQQRLKKLDRLEPKYSELLKSYRIAHARNKFIEPFENALRENTPLTSIADPSALVEYLNQSTLKTGMVMEELKRLSTERDDLKKMLEESVKQSKEDTDILEKELANLRLEKSAWEATKANKEADKEVDGDDFFSYESELPRLQEEVQQYEAKMDGLQTENERLKADLASANESAESLKQDLEAATKSLRDLREGKEGADAEKSEDGVRLQSTVDELRSKLKAAEVAAEAARSRESKKDELVESLNKDRQDATDELAHVRNLQNDSLDKIETLEVELENLKPQFEEAKKSEEQALKRREASDKIIASLREQLTQAEDARHATSEELADALKRSQEQKSSPVNGTSTSTPALTAEATNGASVSAGKKKNKKKKKGGKAATSTEPSVQTINEDADDEETAVEDSAFREEVSRLQQQLEEKTATISRLESKIKDQEALQEEIESLRDELTNFGNEHVEAKDRIKTLLAEKAGFQKTVEELEKDMSELRASSAAHAGDAEAHKSLTKEFEELKSTADTLHSDLTAAQQLAASRFKELTDLREVMQKAQPELTSLRVEVAELRKNKVELAARNTEVRRLEAREKELRSEVNRFIAHVKEKDIEIRELTGKIGEGNSHRSSLEERVRKAQRDHARVQDERNSAVTAKEKLAQDLQRAQADFDAAKSTSRNLEQQIKKVQDEAKDLKDELELKTAQYSSAQSLMNNMQDQVQEISAQMKEVRERCESLEEELADAHRLLSERSREGETMRRLLNESDSRAETRIKEMRARMDIAVEERDRAEETASTLTRRRARELDDLKTKVRDAERALMRAVEEKEELSRAESELRRQKVETEKRIRTDEDEVKEVRTAMSQLREALDDTETSRKQLESEKADLRKSLEETTIRLEKSQKSSKELSDQLKATKVRTAIDPSIQSSTRSSLESARSPSRLGSPIPPGSLGKGRIGSIASSERDPGVDYVYLKNVLLQFLEQRDKKHQMQLIPVLGMLLHFDKKDEAKWQSVVGAR